MGGGGGGEREPLLAGFSWARWPVTGAHWAGTRRERDPWGWCLALGCPYTRQGFASGTQTVGRAGKY